LNKSIINVIIPSTLFKSQKKRKLNKMNKPTYKKLKTEERQILPLHIPKSVHRWIKTLAGYKGTSMTEYILNSTLQQAAADSEESGIKYQYPKGFKDDI
jgi:hypothetical protein